MQSSYGMNRAHAAVHEIISHGTRTVVPSALAVALAKKVANPDLSDRDKRRQNMMDKIREMQQHYEYRAMQALHTQNILSNTSESMEWTSSQLSKQESSIPPTMTNSSLPTETKKETLPVSKPETLTLNVPLKPSILTPEEVAKSLPSSKPKTQSWLGIWL